jgi:hypothetical protein
VSSERAQGQLVELAAVTGVVSDEAIAKAVRYLAAEDWTQRHPYSFVGQLVGWLSAESESVAS